MNDINKKLNITIELESEFVFTMGDANERLQEIEAFLDFAKTFLKEAGYLEFQRPT